MNLRETVELAAWVSQNSSSLIDSESTPHENQLLQFWNVWQDGIGRWMRQLHQLAKGTSGWNTEPGRRYAQALMANVLTAEMLTRVTAAALVAADRRRETERCGPVARNVLHAQITASHVALRLLVEGNAVSETATRDLYRLRRRVERWTDLLLGHLIHHHRIDDFVFEPGRAWDFGCEFSDSSDRGDAGWNLTLLGLQLAFQIPVELTPALMRQNSTLGAAVAELFPAHVLAGEQGSISRMIAFERLPQEPLRSKSRRWGYREAQHARGQHRPPFSSPQRERDEDGLGFT